ncbi:MAG TPA: Imm27 family immunity protein [Usitatibacteraceae bacterium]
MNIQPTETKITGKWVFENGKLVADASAMRIDHLIKNELVEKGRSDDGWSVLYFDKRDGRYWELNYPDSSQHGGGAPNLELLSREDAFKKYSI